MLTCCSVDSFLSLPLQVERSLIGVVVIIYATVFIIANHYFASRTEVENFAKQAQSSKSFEQIENILNSITEAAIIVSDKD